MRFLVAGRGTEVPNVEFLKQYLCSSDHNTLYLHSACMLETGDRNRRLEGWWKKGEKVLDSRHVC